MFLLQTRQHHELYVWLQIEYKLKPLYAKRTEIGEFRRAIIELSQREAIVQAWTALGPFLDDETSLSASKVMHLLLDYQKGLYSALCTSWYPKFVMSALYAAMLSERGVSNRIKGVEEMNVASVKTSRQQIKLDRIIRMATWPSDMHVHFRPCHAEKDVHPHQDTGLYLVAAFQVSPHGSVEFPNVRCEGIDSEGGINQFLTCLKPFLAQEANLSEKIEAFCFVIQVHSHQRPVRSSSTGCRV